MGVDQSFLSHQMKNNTRVPVSTITIDHQLATSNLYTQNKTLTNRYINTNSKPLSQISIANQSFSSTNNTTNNSAILETFIEYRRLKRDLQRAKNANEAWKADYQALSRRMQKLESSSFHMLILSLHPFI